MENSNQESITWFPVGVFRRRPQVGQWVTYSGLGKLTFSRVLAKELEERRIRFGEKDGKLCFARLEEYEVGGILVRRRQVTDSVLRRHADLEPGTRVHFDFDPEQDIFIESRRERIGPSGGASGTIGATRQPAELQP